MYYSLYSSERNAKKRKRKRMGREELQVLSLDNSCKEFCYKGKYNIWYYLERAVKSRKRFGVFVFNMFHVKACL